MSQQAARRWRRCPGGTSPRTADRERRLERLAVTVLTALGEGRRGPDAERRASAVLQTITDDDGMSLRESRRFGRRRNHLGG